MFVTSHACSFCGEEDSWCLAAGPGDQLRCDRPHAAWLCSRCAWRAGCSGADFTSVTRGEPCATCGCAIGRRRVTIFRETFQDSASGARWSVQTKKPRLVLRSGGRALCSDCLSEARRLLSSPWIRAARDRWSTADIFGDGPYAVLGCDRRRVVLWGDGSVAHLAALAVEPVLCGPDCRGQHALEGLERGPTG